MELVIVGYFNRFDAFKNVRLVNLEPESMEKLKKCGKNLYPLLDDDEYKSPLIPNGAIIKHDTRALCYDVDGVPTSTDQLMGQLVEARVKVKKYSMIDKVDGGRITGWTMKLIKIKPALLL